MKFRGPKALKDAARNIQQLYERLRKGKYLEDKIAQRATGEVLNAIYEQDFLVREQMEMIERRISDGSVLQLIRK